MDIIKKTRNDIKAYVKSLNTAENKVDPEMNAKWDPKRIISQPDSQGQEYSPYDESCHPDQDRERRKTS